MMYLKFSRLLVLVYLAGCAVGPNYVRPPDYLPDEYIEDPIDETVSVDTKEGDAQYFIYGEDLPLNWWELFQSESLNELVEASLIHNPTVAAAQAALRVAIQNLVAEEGFFFPTTTVGFNPTYNKTSEALTPVVSNNSFYYSLYTAQVAVSYTPDLFGGVRRQVESLRALARADSYNLEATYLTLTTNVVNAAIQEAGLRGQIAATKKMIAALSKVLKIFEELFELGQISEVDVTVQEASLAVIEATLPPLEKQLAIVRDLLKTLTGIFPSETLCAEFTLDSLQLPTELPLSLPSTLVENRPDVRAAEEQLHAASALIGVAVANRLPLITLDATYGWISTSLGTLFSPGNVFWSLGANIVQTVFDGGTLKHREYAARAAYDQAAAQYRSTVLNAFQNVADSLQAIEWDALALRAADRAAKAAAKSFKIASSQLDLGDINLVILLAAEQAYHQSLLLLVQAQTNRLADTVALFQALGGGSWLSTCCEE